MVLHTELAKMVVGVQIRPSHPRRGGHRPEHRMEAFDGAIWTVYSNDPAKHVEKDPDQEVQVPRLVRLEMSR